MLKAQACCYCIFFKSLNLVKHKKIITQNKVYMKNDDFFQKIVSLTSDIIWEVDKNWCFTSISGKFKEYIGYAADEVIGKTLFSLMPGKEAERLSIMFHEITSRRDFVTDVEIKLINEKDIVSYLKINAIPVFDEKNNFKGYKGIARDITDKKNIETALKISERHLFTLMNNLPGMAYRGHFTNDIKNSFKMDFVSDGCYQLTGYTPSDFMDIGLSSDSFTHPEDTKMIDETILKALSEKKQFEVLYRIITADSMLKWVMAKGFGIYSKDKLTGIEGFAFDVTETRDAINYGRINENRFRNLFEKNPQGIALGDRDGFVIKTNKVWNRMFGYPVDYKDKIHFTDLRQEQDKESDLLLYRSLFKGINETYRIERLSAKSDSTTFWCDLTVALIEDPEEKDIYAIGIYSDITERKNIEAELKRFHEELEILVSERTEEINRLTLQVINSQENERQRIAMDLHDGVGQTILAAKYAINSITSENSKNKTLLERGKLLIDMASQELREVYTGIYPSMLNELGLNDTINWFIRNFLETSGIIVNHRNTLITKISHNLSVNIFRIIQEIFNNIVKHSEALSVDVSLTQTLQFIIIELSDDGKGFNIEERKKTSTGAGLINIRQRVEHLNGNIEMESLPGRTWIKIQIPMEKE